MSPLSPNSNDCTHVLAVLPEALRALVVLCRECRAPSKTAESITHASEDSLKRLRISRSELEWLLKASYISRVPADDPYSPSYRSATCHRRSRENYFIVTPAGAAFLEAVITAVGMNPSVTFGDGLQDRETPHWNGHELWFRDVVLKRFRKPAPNQVCLLEAFELRRWPAQIDDPLPRGRDIAPGDRLHDAVKRLNRSLDPPLLRFSRNGRGTGVCWRALASPLQM